MTRLLVLFVIGIGVLGLGVLSGSLLVRALKARTIIRRLGWALLTSLVAVLAWVFSLVFVFCFAGLPVPLHLVTLLPAAGLLLYAVLPRRQATLGRAWRSSGSLLRPSFVAPPRPRPKYRAVLLLLAAAAAIAPFLPRPSLHRTADRTSTRSSLESLYSGRNRAALAYAAWEREQLFFHRTRSVPEITTVFGPLRRSCAWRVDLLRDHADSWGAGQKRYPPWLDARAFAHPTEWEAAHLAPPRIDCHDLFAMFDDHLERARVAGDLPAAVADAEHVAWLYLSMGTEWGLRFGELLLRRVHLSGATGSLSEQELDRLRWGSSAIAAAIQPEASCRLRAQVVRGVSDSIAFRPMVDRVASISGEDPTACLRRLESATVEPRLDDQDR